jgi:general secretion pathway protein J
MRRITRGFTLIEVIIAAAVLAAMGAATFGMFKQQYTQKENTEAIDDRYAQIRSALDRMAAEISEAFLSEHFDKRRYRERPTLFRGRDRGHEDELVFTALANERFETDSKVSDQAVISYFVDRDPNNQGSSALFRRVNPIIDEDADRRGRKSPLCEKIKQFDIEYWDTLKAEWVDEWDASRTEHQGVLPERVRLTIVAPDEEGKDRKFSTQARIMIQRSLDF